VNNEASGGAEQRRVTARAYQRLAPAVYAGVVLKRDEVNLDESWRKLQRAEALRDARFIVEAKRAADELSCSVCGLKLADSDALTEARLGGGGQKGNLRPVYSSKDGRTWVCNRCFRDYQKLVHRTVELPYMRQLHSPVTPDQLTPLDPRCRIVQFLAARDRPFTDADFRLLGEFMRQYPDVPFRVYGTLKDLEFLRYFPGVRKFQADVWDLQSLDGLRFLPSDLESLGVGNTKSKRYSLKFLERFPALKSLFLEGHSKDFPFVDRLTQLERLSLRSITLPDLSVLTRLPRLRSLAIKLGGTTDLRLLPRVGKLRYFELWMVRGLTDVSSIAELEYLQYLFLQSLKQVTALPGFRKLRSLRRVRLETMKGLRDLTPIREAPALEDLIVIEMPQLAPEAFRPFAGHPTLRQAAIGLGSIKKNRQARAALGLPQVEGKFVFTPSDEGQSKG
jgi:hypothetical protein